MHVETTSIMKYPLFRNDSDERQRLIRQPDSHLLITSINTSEDLRYRNYILSVLGFVLIVILFTIIQQYDTSLALTSQDVVLETVTAKLQPTISDIAPCSKSPCFESTPIHVPINKPGFPSFLSYANQGSIDVSYDSRSLLLNHERAFFLGGSMHPARATQQTWNMALDEVVQNGLNLITIYVMWSDHQPFSSEAIDWSFVQGVSCHSRTSENRCDWSLATAIRSAAERGLFVHLRLGPYTCAEYSYGGIPEWLPLEKPQMDLRRPNREWLEAMESWVTQTVEYIRSNRLWAYQGGPIIMSQIENELAGDELGLAEDDNSQTLWVDEVTGDFVDSDTRRSNSVRKATLQDYADWCGAIAAKYEPKVTWTMCNGLTARNTIHTCNSQDTGAEWLENYGENGRIQVDQPPIFTEFEEGFQDWGEAPNRPNDYFWGRTARDSTRHALRWFARGGTHLNYYMFYGSYNRGRQAAAGITNFYASDAALCSSGERHQPKFSHYAALHRVLADIAPVLLAAPTALWKSKKVKIKDENGCWTDGTKQRVFEYFVEGDGHVAFLENDASESVTVEVNSNADGRLSTYDVRMEPFSASILVDGVVVFDSATINSTNFEYKREFTEGPTLLDWSTWPESIGVSLLDQMTRKDSAPVEQTLLNVGSRVVSQYAWYETHLNITEQTSNAKLMIESQRSNGLLIYLDDVFLGDVEDHSHLYEGPWTMEVRIGRIMAGIHRVSILSESFGYSNLIGRFGNSGTGPKEKGITGDVILSFSNGVQNVSLVDGREWLSFPGLHGELMSDYPNKSVYYRNFRQLQKSQESSNTPAWFSTLFESPIYSPSDEGLFLQIPIGRGHVWLNGKDLGRFWNITRGETDNYTQQYYFLPIDYLKVDESLNEITIFDVYGSYHPAVTRLIWSSVVSSKSAPFMDEVSYPLACLY